MSWEAEWVDLQNGLVQFPARGKYVVGVEMVMMAVTVMMAMTVMMTVMTLVMMMVSVW